MVIGYEYICHFSPLVTKCINSLARAIDPGFPWSASLRFRLASSNRPFPVPGPPEPSEPTILRSLRCYCLRATMIPATMATNMAIANITVITLYMANSSFRLLTALCKCAFFISLYDAILPKTNNDPRYHGNEHDNRKHNCNHTIHGKLLLSISSGPHTHLASSYHDMVQADVVDLRQVMRMGLQHGDPLSVDDSVYFAFGVI